jgi:hypothetical protein
MFVQERGHTFAMCARGETFARFPIKHKTLFNTECLRQLQAIQVECGAELLDLWPEHQGDFLKALHN